MHTIVASARTEQMTLVVPNPTVILPVLLLNRYFVTMFSALLTNIEWMNETSRPKSMVVTIYRRIIATIVAFPMCGELGVITASFNSACMI